MHNFYQWRIIFKFQIPIRIWRDYISRAEQISQGLTQFITYYIRIYRLLKRMKKIEIRWVEVVFVHILTSTLVNRLSSSIASGIGCLGALRTLPLRVWGPPRLPMPRLGWHEWWGTPALTPPTNTSRTPPSSSPPRLCTIPIPPSVLHARARARAAFAPVCDSSDSRPDATAAAAAATRRDATWRDVKDRASTIDATSTHTCTHTTYRAVHTRTHCGNVNNGRERGGTSSFVTYHSRRRWISLERVGVQGDEPGSRTGSCNRYRRTAVHREYGDFHELSRTRARLPSTDVHHSPHSPDKAFAASATMLAASRHCLPPPTRHFCRACALVDCGAISLGARFKCRISRSQLYIYMFVLWNEFFRIK